MAFTKKTWVDRMVEFAGRRKLTNVSNSSSVVYDVERAEGVVQNEGTAFSAANMNDLETRIANAITATDSAVTALNKNLGGLQFAQDDAGKWGYKVGGADTVHPFNDAAYTLKRPFSLRTGGTGEYSADASIPIKGIKKISFEYSKQPYCNMTLIAYKNTGESATVLSISSRDNLANVHCDYTFNDEYDYLQCTCAPNGAASNYVNVQNFNAYT